MEKESVDLRDLIMMIKEKKEMNANLALEFDCKLEVDDYKPLVKVINYVINYFTELTNETMQISLNAGLRGHTFVVTASTTQPELPPISDKVHEALKDYNAKLELGGEPGKYAKILIQFTN